MGWKLFFLLQVCFLLGRKHNQVFEVIKGIWSDKSKYKQNLAIKIQTVNFQQEGNGEIFFLGTQISFNLSVCQPVCVHVYMHVFVYTNNGKNGKTEDTQRFQSYFTLK